MEAVSLTSRERELADELLRSLSVRHQLGRRSTLELRADGEHVVEVFAHIRIARGRDDDAPIFETPSDS
jgi:hypothetical protein